MKTTGRTKTVFFLLIFIAGYINLSLELIAMRQLTPFVGGNAVISSIIIGIFLICLTLGYYTGSKISLTQKKLRKIISYGLLTAAAMIVLGSSYILMDGFMAFFERFGLSNIQKTVVYALVFLSIPPFLFGKMTASISRALARTDRNETGRIMAVDTIGSVLGSLVTTLVIMPLLGTQTTVVLLVGLACLGTMLVGKAETRKITGIMVLLMVLAAYLNNAEILREKKGVVAHTELSTIKVIETDGGYSKVLEINGSSSSKISTFEALNYAYVTFIEKTFIKTMPNDDMKILVLGAGGFTIGLGDKRSNHIYTYIDIEKKLQEITEENFLGRKLDSNKVFIAEDAFQFVKNTKETYDLIILDVYSSHVSIPDDLVTREFFTHVKEKLKPGGIMAANIITDPVFGNSFSRNVDATVRSVFDPVTRQIVQPYDGWMKDGLRNIVYTYHNTDKKGSIYTLRKNSAVYDQ